jgi:hypothetical protein
MWLCSKVLNLHSEELALSTSAANINPWDTKMKKIGVVVALIFIVVLGGFAYAYFNKLNVFNQTKSKLESMGYQVTGNMGTINISTMKILPAANLASFVSDAKKYQATTIYQQSYSFYIIVPIMLNLGEAVQYTPNNSVWWVW